MKDKTDETSFAVCAADLLETTDIEEELFNQIEAIGTKIDNYTRNGWLRFCNIWNLNLYIVFILLYVN